MGFSIGIPESFIGLICDLQIKDPGPETPPAEEFGTPGGVTWVITFTHSVQVSGFGCQVSASEVDPLCRSRS